MFQNRGWHPTGFSHWHPHARFRTKSSWACKLVPSVQSPWRLEHRNTWYWWWWWYIRITGTPFYKTRDVKGNIKNSYFILKQQSCCIFRVAKPKNFWSLWSLSFSPLLPKNILCIGMYRKKLHHNIFRDERGKKEGRWLGETLKWLQSWSHSEGFWNCHPASPLYIGEERGCLEEKDELSEDEDGLSLGQSPIMPFKEKEARCEFEKDSMSSQRLLAQS